MDGRIDLRGCDFATVQAFDRQLLCQEKDGADDNRPKSREKAYEESHEREASGLETANRSSSEHSRK
jgi:hypothetical protein